MEVIYPLDDKMLVRPITEQKSAGGIIIQKAQYERDEIEGTRAEVLAVGPGHIEDDGTRRKMQVKVGDTVILGKYGHIHIEYRDEKHLLICERDVAAVVGHE